MLDGGGSVASTENLTRMFGGRRAVDGVSISVSKGDVLAIFGPNGAGKTTLLRMLGGIIKPTSGKAQVGGIDLPGSAEVRRRIGIISHNSLLYDALTALENVEFVARLYGVANASARARAALDLMGILDRARTPVRLLSRGMKQRVSVARAIVHDPELVLADEPFTGLDVAGAKALTLLLETLRARGVATFLVTHNIEEGLSLATHAAVMNAGRVVRHSSRSSIDPAAFVKDYQELVASG